jgi:hypothetical protein
MSSVCLQLGSATVGSSDNNTEYSLVVAETADASKTGLALGGVEKLDWIVEGSELASLLNPMQLATWTPYLSPTGVVSFTVKNAGSHDLQVLQTAFLLAGLVGVGERREPDGSKTLTATKPKAAPKIAAAPLKKKKTTAAAAVVMSLDDDDDMDDDDDVIDEDGLLDDALLAPPPAMSAAAVAATDDCAGRKPCDNCSCGRAEVYAAEQAGTPVQAQAPSSNCGKCNLGDAFRCASCPFLGKPAFKAGEEHVVLQMTDDL